MAETKSDLFSIVLLGGFNPLILHPFWLARLGLVPPQEVESLDKNQNQICSAEYSAFKLMDIDYEIQGNRFLISTSDESKVIPMQNVAAGIFSTLEHTPVTAIGFNYDCRLSMNSSLELEKTIDHYVPRNNWKGIIDAPYPQGVSLRGNWQNGEPDHVLITLRIPRNDEKSLAVSINQHYDLVKSDSGDDKMAKNGKHFLELIESEWRPFLRKAKETVQQVASLSCDSTTV